MLLLQDLYWYTLALSGQRRKLHVIFVNFSVIFLILTAFLANFTSRRTCAFYLQLLLLRAIYIRKPLVLLFLLLNFEGFVTA